MKITVSLEEVKRIVAQHLRVLGYDVDADDAMMIEHSEGQYEDAVTVLDGIAFELSTKKVEVTP